MIINVSNFSAVRPKKGSEHRGHSVRFAVSFHRNNGDVGITIDGWLMNRERDMSPPKTMLYGGNRQYNFIHLMDWFKDEIIEKLETIPVVQKVLGPRITDRNESFPGTYEVYRDDD